MAQSPSRARQVIVSERLWEIFSLMSEDSGRRVDDLVAEAMFEMAVKLGYVKPIAKEMANPADAEPAARPTVRPPAGQKFAPGRTKEAPSRRAPAAGQPPRPAPRPAPAPAARGLYIVNEAGESEKVDKDIFIIGRSSKCDLVINSVKVSREHAIITRERGEYYIEDLGSANGTWYKGEKIEKMKIKDGDEIFICDEKFKFVIR